MNYDGEIVREIGPSFDSIILQKICETNAFLTFKAPIYNNFNLFAYVLTL